MRTTRALLASLLPIEAGPFAISLEPGEALALRYRGVVQAGSVWSPQPPKAVDAVIDCDTLPRTPDAKLELALRAWAQVAREAVTGLATREEPSLAARDVLDLGLLRELHDAKKPVTEADFVQRWRWRLAAALPTLPELEAGARAVTEFYEDDSMMAEGAQEDRVVALHFVHTDSRPGAVTVVARLVVWDRDGEKLSIRDVKEQEVSFLEAGPGLDPARLKAYLTALRECVSLQLARCDPGALMPHDLLLRPQAFKRGETVDDFRAALRKKLKLQV